MLTTQLLTSHHFKQINKKFSIHFQTWIKITQWTKVQSFTGECSLSLIAQANHFNDSFLIKIIFRNVETLPRIVKSLKDLRCCDGDAVTLECLVEGSPEPNVFWIKDGKILHENETDYKTKFDGKKATLAIPKVFPDDEGEYTLVAANDMGRAYSSACIIVDGKFLIFMGP